MNNVKTFKDLLRLAIRDGYKTIKVKITSSSHAEVLVRTLGRWFHYAVVDSVDVIRSMRNATSSKFNIAQLIDRCKIPSATIGSDIGSMVLRYKPLERQAIGASPNREALGTLTLSGLRMLSSSAAAA